MTEWVNTIGPNNTLEEAVEQMSEKKTNSLVVVDKKDKPIGVISSHLLIKEIVPEYLKGSEITAQFSVKGTLSKYAQKAKDHKVKDFMYKNIHVLDPDDAMIEAATYVVEGARRVLPVVDKEGKLMGAVTRTSVKIALHDALKELEEEE